MSDEHSTHSQPSGRRNWIIAALLAVGAIGVVFASRQVVDEDGAAVPTFDVRQGEFVISLELKGGELEAKEAENVVAPRVHGQLKIVELFPEGDQAAVGDLLVLFEQTDFEKRVKDAEQELESAKADLEKTLALQKAELSRLAGDIKDAESNLRLADLQVERMAFEATVEKERAQIEAQKARLSYEQAVEKLESQEVVNNAEVRKRQLKISRQERDLDKARRELESTTINAEKPGLVVYGKVWKGDRPEKIRVGDEIWGGVNVISLPDLSSMQVKTFVNEVDVDKVALGQRCTIKLDALAEPTFHGEVTSIASLGRDKEGEKNVKVFDVTVAIEEQDDRLKPGMTATATVTVETIPAPPEAPADSIEQDVGEIVVDSQPLPLSVPLDAIFESDGRTVVYRMSNGAPQQTDVVLGKRNEDYIIIEEGLAPGDRVALRDPTLVSDDIGGMTQADGGSSPQVQ
jgi:HlyD family secretion protein